MVATSFRDHTVWRWTRSRGRRVSTSACGGVAIEFRDRTCPLDSAGVTPRLARWGLRLPMRHRASSSVPLYGPSPDWRSASDLPSFPLCPVDVPRSSTPVGSRGLGPCPSDRAFHVLTHSAPPSLFITGLNPFTLAHCGPSTLCVRFMTVVTSPCNTPISVPARASGAGPAPADRAELCSAL